MPVSRGSPFSDTFSIRSRAMVFVDGENFAIRLEAEKAKHSGTFPSYAFHLPSVYFWMNQIHLLIEQKYDRVRTYYYTSVKGDEPKVREVEQALKSCGIEAPRVFKKKPDKRTKRVDISLATDMLTHAHRNNYDVAVLIAGDEDYVPLVDAVIGEGKRVHLIFISNGLSNDLRLVADFYSDITPMVFGR